MNNFNEFVDLFFSSDYFIFFLAVIAVILLVIIGYMIKLSVSVPKNVASKNIIPKSEEIELENADIIEDSKICEHLNNMDFSVNPIEAYELNEEENAIISAKELQNIELQRDEAIGVEASAALIEEYEQQQEMKAIISYEELLKNAQGLELKYLEQNDEYPEEAPMIKQVEIETNLFKGVSYTAEEEYLKILKEFKMSLTK